MSSYDLRETPITVVGAGAIGGTVGAFLTQAGYDVTLVDIVSEHVEIMNAEGLRISGLRGDQRYPVRAIHASQLQGPLPAVFLCVKGHATESAIASIAPHLADDAFVLSLQNGLNEAIIADHIGRERTVGCFVHFGADYLQPGHILLGTEQTIFPGELNGTITPRLEAIGTALEHVMPVSLTTNIWGYLWGKLVYGAMAFAVSTVDAPVPEIIGHPLGMRISQQAAAEAYAIASTQAEKLENIAEFNPNAFEPGPQFDAHSRAALQAMADAMAGSVKQHMGIWRDLAIKKRKTEVDMQTGALVAKADELGIAVPVNQAVLDLVHAIETGRQSMEWSNLDLIAEAAGLSA